MQKPPVLTLVGRVRLGVGRGVLGFGLKARTERPYKFAP